MDSFSLGRFLFCNFSTSSFLSHYKLQNWVYLTNMNLTMDPRNNTILGSLFPDLLFPIPPTHKIC